MSENPPPIGPIVVAVELGNALDVEAFSARINQEPGWRAFPSGMSSEWDVTLAERCPGPVEDPNRRPTVVLSGSAAAAAGHTPCVCCWSVPRGAAWPSLFRTLAGAVGRTPVTSGAEKLTALTRREMDVLRLVGMGKSVNDCAEALGVAPSTVGNHKYRLMRKLGASNSLQLLRIAVRHGLASFE